MMPIQQKTFFEACTFICSGGGQKNEKDSHSFNLLQLIESMKKDYLARRTNGSTTQLRIALCSDYFTNPKSGIRMIRHQDSQEAAAFAPLRHNILDQVRYEIAQKNC